MHTARTTGYGGFELALEADYTSIDNDAAYWKAGTQGAQDASTKRFSVSNPSPDPVLQHYALRLKGFPFGIELAGQFGFRQHQHLHHRRRRSILTLRGLPHRHPQWFPQITASGSVRTITGTDQFQLTVVGVDGGRTIRN